MAELSALPPLQSLVLEVLAARHRLGESLWTFNASPSVVRAIHELESAGLVGVMAGIVPHTVRASLTDSGRSAALSDTYQQPSAQRINLAELCCCGHMLADHYKGEVCNPCGGSPGEDGEPNCFPFESIADALRQPSVSGWPSEEQVARRFFEWDIEAHPDPKPTWEGLREAQRDVWRSGAAAVMALFEAAVPSIQAEAWDEGYAAGVIDYRSGKWYPTDKGAETWPDRKKLTPNPYRIEPRP